MNQIPEHKRKFRVIDKDNILFGKEYELIADHPKVKKVMLDMIVYNQFDYSQVAEVTPLTFNGKSISKGDEVFALGGWRKVYGYHWYDGKWLLNTTIDNDFEGDCWNIRQESIIDLRQQNQEDDEVTKAIATLEKAGKIKNGKILI